jgi:ribosome-binding protein aMBF1 (putative translation factor)
MELRKRNRGAALRRILARITPEQHARTYKQMSIAARIADAIAAKGWSKGEFAERMNQHPSVISRWLSGTQNFTIDTLSDIEEMLGVQLLCVRDEKPRVVTQTVVRYQTVLVTTNQQHTSQPVLWNAFNESIGQTQPNG